MSTISDEAVPELESMLRHAFSEQAKTLHTMLPGVIESCSNGRAKVNLGTAVKLADGREVRHPPLLDLPVQFPRWGGYSLIMPVSPGDECAVFFSERSLERFKREGGTGKVPTAPRFFSLADGFCVPGLTSLQNPPPAASGCELRSDDGTVIVRLQKGGSVTIVAGILTCAILPTGKVHFTNASGELNATTQAMLEILAGLLSGPTLTAYNNLKTIRNTFV